MICASINIQLFTTSQATRTIETGSPSFQIKEVNEECELQVISPQMNPTEHFGTTNIPRRQKCAILNHPNCGRKCSMRVTLHDRNIHLNPKVNPYGHAVKHITVNIPLRRVSSV